MLENVRNRYNIIVKYIEKYKEKKIKETVCLLKIFNQW